MSLRESILASLGDTSPVVVDVPEWGQSIYLHRFTVPEWMALVSDDDEERPWRILAAAMRDENGEAVLTAAEITAMPSSQTGVLLRLFNEVQRINGADDVGEQ